MNHDVPGLFAIFDVCIMLWAHAGIVLLIFIAYTAWNGRLLEDKLFKFKWVLVFPIFACSFHVIYNILFVLFRFVNYGFLSLVGIDFALILGIVFYILLLFIVSILFLSRKTYSE